MVHIGRDKRFTGFSDPLFRISCEDGQGQVTNKFTGETIYFNNQDEFVRALETLEESEANYKKEKLRLELLIASGGSPEEVRSIYQNTAPKVNGVTFMDSDYKEVMDDDIRDAIRSEARTMTLAQLRKYVKEFPELQLLLDSRLKAEVTQDIRHCEEDAVRRRNPF